MIRIREIAMPAEHSVHQLSYEAARLLKVNNSKVRKISIVRRSVDARKKPDVKIVYTVDVAVEGNEQKILRQSGCKRAAIAKPEYYKPRKNLMSQDRPIVVGFGPAGMFAALVLAIAGLRPIVLERGDDAQTRHDKVEAFFAGGALDPVSNVQFGEGGAGTFSDGKLNTGVNNMRIGWVLEQLVKAGAGEDILFDAKPHVGTDVLLTVVQNIRQRIISLGGEVRFRSQVVGISTENGALTGVQLENGESIPCKQAVFAIGHSARDTFCMLKDAGLQMEQKPFAMGVRIEHKQTTVDAAQYGKVDPVLPPADYKLVKHLDNGTVYTFCMCPGGYVVAAASEEGGVVTNGMSYADRAGENANAALLVTVNPSDLPNDDPLAGMYWQRSIEQAAYRMGGGNYCAPAQTVGDFLAGKASCEAGAVQPTYRPGVVWCDLREVLPAKITDALKEALPQLEQNLKGFSAPEAVLTAPETRSSSPVRILRDEIRQSCVRGLYPTGEGAGYAGGIMSAALDGIHTAEAIMDAIVEGK